MRGNGRIYLALLVYGFNATRGGMVLHGFLYSRIKDNTRRKSVSELIDFAVNIESREIKASIDITMISTCFYSI